MQKNSTVRDLVIKVHRLEKHIDLIEEEKKELEAFNYSVAHDLYAPLVRVEGYAGLLSSDHSASLDREAAEYLRRVASAAKEAKSLLGKLLSYSRAIYSEVVFQPVNVTELVNELLEEISSSDPRRKTVFSVEPNIEVFADRTLMRSVMVNLLENSWKYSAEKDATHISVIQRKQKDQVVVSVVDNGVGFDSEKANSIFMPFNRLAQRSGVKGDGIGLATVERIVRRHNGRVWAESIEGEGSVISIELPELHDFK